jgi:integrase
LKVEEILMYVSGLERSGSYKRNFMCKVKELYREACWYGCNIPVPSFPSFKKNTRKADIFTEDELRSYFNPELYADQNLYLFYLCCLSAALRPGKAHRLRPKQILFDKEALIVDGFVKKNGVRTGYDEKRTGDYTKLRLIPRPFPIWRSGCSKNILTGKGFKPGTSASRLKKIRPGPFPNPPSVTLWHVSSKRREYKCGSGNWQSIPSGTPTQLICGGNSRLGRR